MFLEILLASLVAPQLDGRKVEPHEACYAMTMRGKDGPRTFGTTFQKIRVIKADDGDRLEIVTRQRGEGAKGAFDMEDIYLVRRKDLRPISYRNRTNGVTKVEIAYADRQVTGTRQAEGGSVDIRQSLTGPVWDGALFGPLMSALPLKNGRTYQVPTYQYASGLGSITFSVVGEQSVATPSGAERAWVVEAFRDPARRARYFISKKSRRELGYEAGPMSQMLGGNCSA